MLSHRALVLLLIALISTHVYGQDVNDSEDQVIAQAIWSLVDFGASDPVDVQVAFDVATEAFPQSAHVAYWRGRLGAYASSKSRVLKEVSNILGTLADPQSDNNRLADPSLERKLSAARSFAKRIGERIEQRAKEQSVVNTNEAFEVSLLNAASLNPTLVAAWAGLLESSDTTIALTAADAWANQEPDNALPLYAKAVVLSRDGNRDDPIGVNAIAALEFGNRRPACRAPDEPWPTDFDLSFPNSLPKDVAEFEGKPVTPQMFRKIVEGMFFQIDAIGNGATISESAIRDLGNLILRQSHQLSRQEDVRYLRAFAGVGVHLVQSNRFSYGVTAGSVDRTLNRLETIAVDQSDFESAEQFAEVRDYVIAIRRKVADGYRATEAKGDSARIDLVATKIMDEQKKTIPIPKIRFSEEPKPNLVLGKGDDEKTTMVVMDLFYSSDKELFVRRTDQEFPSQELESKELSDRGYSSLRVCIAALRDGNRKNRRSLGIFLVANGKYMGGDIANECFVNGYIGKTDPCIVAFTAGENLESFREFYPRTDVRVAQILGPGGVFKQDDVDNISESADLVVVPVARLLQEDQQVVPFISSFELKVIATASHYDQLKLVEGIESIVGTASINLHIRAEQDDEP